MIVNYDNNLGPGAMQVVYCSPNIAQEPHRSGRLCQAYLTQLQG